MRIRGGHRITFFFFVQRGKNQGVGGSRRRIKVYIEGGKTIFCMH